MTRPPEKERETTKTEREAELTRSVEMETANDCRRYSEDGMIDVPSLEQFVSIALS